MAVLASHQPDFIPYPGFFYKMLRSDIFILSDDVAYSNSEMHKYNFIIGPEGRNRIGLPVQAHADGTPLKDVRLSYDKRLNEKLLKTFEQTYSRHPFFPQYGPEFMEMIEDAGRTPFLLSLENSCLIYWFAEHLAYDGNIIRASFLNPEGRRDERILDICRKVGGVDEYLSGLGAAAYHEPEKYEAAGVRLTYTDYKPIVYPQYGNRGEFVPNLSMIDYVMNCGFELPKEWRECHVRRDRTVRHLYPQL